MGFLQGIGQFFDGPKQIVIPVKSTAISPTYTIVLIIFGLVFFFQPLVFDAYKKGKARYAWRKIDNGNKVEVLDYKRTRMWDVRGQWDARRVTALLLFVFDIAMIILVLQMDVAYESDAAVENFYIQPPPVCVNNTTWEVRQADSFNLNIDSMRNMEGDFKNGSAKAMYKVDRTLDPIVYGQVRVAFWSEDAAEAPTDLIYEPVDQIATLLEDLDCTSGRHAFNLSIEEGEGRWGNVTICGKGPKIAHKEDGVPPPAIVLHPREGYVHIIVEERSTYPSFSYSVWKKPEYFNDSGRKLVNVTHAFHIASTSPLVEAVVTEIVHAVKEDRDATGGGAFALVREFSRKIEGIYSDNTNDRGCEAPTRRAMPFGEHPKSESLKGIELSDVETIEKGVKLNTNALVVTSVLLTLSVIGFVWWLCLCSNKGVIDIYDRDELIRSLEKTSMEPSSGIFVSKDVNGNIRVELIDNGNRQSRTRMCWWSREITQDDNPRPVAAGRETDAVVLGELRAVPLKAPGIGRDKEFPVRDDYPLYSDSVSVHVPHAL